MVIISWIPFSCASPEGLPADRIVKSARTGDATANAAPDCELLTLCPTAGVDATRCVDDPALFRVEQLDGRVVNVELVPTQDIVLPASEVFAVFPDPEGGCALTMVSFRASDLVAAERSEETP